MNKHYTRAPHRRGTPSEDFAPNAALLIDFDNVTMAIRSNLAQELENLLNSEIIRGKVAVQRAYADWRRYPQYIVPLSESSIDLIFAPAYGSSKKNATDIRLAIDALELVFTRPEIGTYIMLSGDSDFSSLVLKLKEYGKYVIGVGMQESSSDILVQNCDEYYSYTSLSGLREASEVQAERADPWDLVERAIRKMTDRSDVMRSDRLKQVMLELDPAFDEKAIGYSKFNRFLAEAASRDKVRLRKAANGQYEVSPAEGGRSGRREGSDRPRVSRGRQEGSRSGAPAPRHGERGDKGDRGRRPSEGAVEGVGPGVSAAALRDAYGLLSRSVGGLSGDGEAVRDSEVKRTMLAEEGDFDETALGFRKFSRFLQQAHDEGVIDLEQGEDGNYYIRPLGGQAGGRGARGAERAASESREERPRRGGARERSPRSRRERTVEAPETEARAPEERDEEVQEEEVREEASGPSRVAAQPGEGDRSAREGRGSGARSGAGARSAPDRERARRGLGRFRRGSRAGPEPGARAAVSGIGPVDLPEGAGSGSGERTGTTSGEEAQSGSAPSGLGLFRRGSRAAGPSGPAGTGPTAASAGSPPESGGGPSGSHHVVDHMVRNYPGVGERTAARLVQEFGDDVFEVIDRQPDRVTELLSERRARAVFDARQAERNAGGTGDSD